MGLKRWSEHLGWSVLFGSSEQALHPSPCHPQTFCLSSCLCNPLTHSQTQPLLSRSHSLDTTHPPTHPPTHPLSLSNTFFCSSFHADASPLDPVLHNIPSCLALAPSLSRPYAEQRHFLLLSMQALQPHPAPVYSLQ